MNRSVIAVTSGEPAGIGPELCLMLARREWDARLVVLADITMLQQRLTQLGLHVALSMYRPHAPGMPGVLEVLHCPLHAESLPGQVDVRNAPYVLGMLDRAVAGCISGEFSAMVTAPVHKAVIADSGVPFMGHTEYLAEKTHTSKVVMMLAGTHMLSGRQSWLRVALATTHLPLAQVSSALSVESLTQTLRILHDDLVSKFGLSNPRILVAGLNPHAGESGHLGCEERDVIEPVIGLLRAEGMQLSGPLPADTLFTPHHLEQADAVLAMYHDQGLPVLKYATFGNGINITLGLPIIRTSVDHGTALDLAGSGRADPGSLYAAVEAAAAMCGRH